MVRRARVGRFVRTGWALHRFVGGGWEWGEVPEQNQCYD